MNGDQIQTIEKFQAINSALDEIRNCNRQIYAELLTLNSDDKRSERYLSLFFFLLGILSGATGAVALNAII